MKLFIFDTTVIDPAVKYTFLKYLFVLLCIFELLLISFFRNFAGPINSPVYLLCTSVAIAILYYMIKREKNAQFSDVSVGAGKKVKTLLLIAVFISISSLIFIRLHFIIQSNEISIEDSSFSDIIPQTEILVNRLADHEKVYQPIQFEGYRLYPTYLPLQWMPYLICERLNFDYRWLAAFVFWIIALIFFIRYSHGSNNIITAAFISCYPLLVWFTLMLYDQMQFAFMLESLIAAYYLCAMMSLAIGNKITSAVSFAFCLLSRYAIVLWMPFYFFYKLLIKEYRSTLVIGSILIFAFGLIYCLPFFRTDQSIFIKGYNYHSSAALGEWQHLNEKGQPAHLFNGLGLAAWGYKFLHQQDITSKLHIWQKIHFFTSAFVVLAMAAVYYFKRSTIRAKPYLMMSFKIYLIIFYVFIQIPYSYLFFVPVIVTSVLIADLFYLPMRKSNN